ncbi:MAG: phosphatase PAP2 family protein [Crocinitomicaceae bacterium]
MITAFKKTNIYLTLSAVLIIAGLILLKLNDKIDFHLFVNRFHTDFLDVFFKWITHAGDGTVLAITSVSLVIVYWKKYSYSLLTFAAINLILVAAIVQTLKRLIYFDAFRPAKFIGYDLLYLVPGVDIHTDNSFPSGHTTAAFAFFALLALLLHKKKWMQVVCLIMAALAGYSRMYLSQHFLEDVVAGASIGICCFLVTYLIVSTIPFKNNITK